MIGTKGMLIVLAALLGGGALLQPTLLPAQDFPKRSISLIIPYAPGGSVDLLARAMTKVSGKHFPVQVLVVNQPGGAAIPGRVTVVNAKPDGYTLLFGYGSGEDLVTPHTQKLPYHQFKDLVPVCQMSIVSLILSVSSNHPAKNLKEFVEWAKRQNRQITGAVSTRGASVDITMQAIMKVAGVKAETIPFRGDSEALTALLGGHTDFAGNTPPAAFPHVKAGRVRILGVCLRERDPIIPEVPTFMEQGFDVFTMGAIRGVGAPKGTPDAVIDYLEKTFKKVADDPEFHSVTREIQTPVMYRDRAAFLKNMTDGFEMYGQLIDKLGLKEQK